MRNLLFALFCVLSFCSVNAAAVDWGVNLSESGYEAFKGGTVYSYVLTSKTSQSVADVVASWAADPSYSGGTGIWAGSGANSWESSNPVITSSVANMTIDSGRPPEYLNYVVVIIEKDGQYIWASYGDGSTIDIPNRGDTEGVTPEDIVWFDKNSQWTLVPEPTVLALLALGVAGLALCRKVA